MKTSQNVSEIIKALGAFQAEVKAIAKQSDGFVGSGRKYKYADLASIWAAIGPLLTKAGLVITQTVEYEGQLTFLETTVWHKDQYILSRGPIVCAKTNDIQAWGASMTYSRRYYLAALLGLVTDEDTDGKEAMPQAEKAKGYLTKDEKEKVNSFSKSNPLTQSSRQFEGEFLE